jgi:HEPN superfamily RiboL-PSP-like protein
MTTNIKLKDISNDFLISSDLVFDECVDGLKNLDRIVVDVNSSLAPLTRGYLIPIIYAYWEKFFRTVFLEYLRCIEIVQIDLEEVNPDVISLRFRKELRKTALDKKIPELHEIANKLNLEEMKNLIERLTSQLSQPLSFPDNIDWVGTESNVSAKVLSKTCDRLKVDFEKIKEDLENQKFYIFKSLKDLVDARNSIAHGEGFQFINADEWNEHKTFVKELMMALQFTLFEHLSENQTILQ